MFRFFQNLHNREELCRVYLSFSTHDRQPSSHLCKLWRLSVLQNVWEKIKPFHDPHNSKAIDNVGMIPAHNTRRSNLMTFQMILRSPFFCTRSRIISIRVNHDSAVLNFFPFNFPSDHRHRHRTFLAKVAKMLRNFLIHFRRENFFSPLFIIIIHGLAVSAIWIISNKNSSGIQ